MTPEEFARIMREPSRIGAWESKANEPCVLYYLADPRTPRHPRYVGITTDPVMRAKKHAQMQSGNDLLWRWKRELREFGLTPMFVPIASFAALAEGTEAEWRLIRRWERRGLCDCNATDGGHFAFEAEWNARNSRNRKSA